MDPPEQVQNVFLRNNDDDVTIYFKTFLNTTTHVEKELSKETFLGYMINYCDNIKYSLDTSNKILNITGIKVLNIITNSSLSKKNTPPTESISLIMNYESIYSESANNLIIKGTIQVIKGDTFMCASNNLVIDISINENKLMRRKMLNFKLTYTNSADDINAFHKKNIAHSIRKLIIPFKLAIE